MDRDGAGLMRRLIEHGSESEQFALGGRFTDDYFLMVRVNRGHTDFAFHHDISLTAWIVHLIDSLAFREGHQLDLGRQHGHLFVVQESKKGDVSQKFRIARHLLF